jgi:hypothetical protein
VTDDELTDAWEAVLGRPITHDEHLRIAFTLIRRWGQEAGRRLLIGTQANCEAMGAADRFDADLTARWAERIGACVEVDGERARSYDDFIARHPELRRGDLLGLPEWKRLAP